MPRNNKHTELDSLITEIKQLNIQHSRISDRLIEISTRVKQLQSETNHPNLDQAPSSDSISSKKSFATRSRRKLNVGDTVIIRNPEQHRPNTGIIIKFTPGGFAKIDLRDNKKPLRRLPINLTKDE